MHLKIGTIHTTVSVKAAGLTAARSVAGFGGTSASEMSADTCACVKPPYVAHFEGLLGVPATPLQLHSRVVHALDVAMHPRKQAMVLEVFVEGVDGNVRVDFFVAMLRKKQMQEHPTDCRKVVLFFVQEMQDVVVVLCKEGILAAAIHKHSEENTFTDFLEQFDLANFDLRTNGTMCKVCMVDVAGHKDAERQQEKLVDMLNEDREDTAVLLVRWFQQRRLQMSDDETGIVLLLTDSKTPHAEKIMYKLRLVGHILTAHKWYDILETERRGASASAKTGKKALEVHGSVMSDIKLPFEPDASATCYVLKPVSVNTGNNLADAIFSSHAHDDLCEKAINRRIWRWNAEYAAMCHPDAFYRFYEGVREASLGNEAGGKDLKYIMLLPLHRFECVLDSAARVRVEAEQRKVQAGSLLFAYVKKQLQNVREDAAFREHCRLAKNGLQCKAACTYCEHWKHFLSPCAESLHDRTGALMLADREEQCNDVKALRRDAVRGAAVRGRRRKRC